MKDNNQRGMLTDKVQEIANKFLGEKITLKELRLYPYIDYCLKNGGVVERAKLDNKEFEILAKKQAEGHLKKSGKYITVTRNFYNYMQDVLAESYVLFE